MAKTPAEKLLQKAKVQIVIAPSTEHRPATFFSTVLLNLPTIIDASVETACTDGVSIRINPDKMLEWDLENTKGVLIHEVMHIVRGHHHRRGGRDKEIWNEACDYEINPVIKDARFVLPEGALFNQTFIGKSAEEIYNIIKDFPRKNKGNGSGSNQPGGGGSPNYGIGGIEDSPATNTPQQNQAQQDWRIMVNQAAIAQKMKGDCPAWVKRYIEEINEAKKDWKSLLMAFLIDALNPCNYSWQRPNPRYISLGLYLPRLSNDKKANIVVFVDTSGSIGEVELKEFGGELQGIMEVTKSTVTVVYIDADVAGVETFEPEDQIVLKAVGGGGTDFRPGFKWLEDQTDLNPGAVVYFTDGYGTFPPEPSVPTLWAMTSDVEVPFGERIQLEF